MEGKLPLACPRCGGENLVCDQRPFPCVHCHGVVQRAPHGRAWLLLPVEEAVPGEEEVARLLERAMALEDPAKKKALLLQAVETAPDWLPVHEELLHLGRLDQRGKVPMDYHLIKCYLLHAFEAPDEEPDRIPAMMEELVAHPQLTRCLDLAADQAGFIRRYLIRLSREYIRIFLVGSNRYIPRIFGFATRSPDQALGLPCARMIRRMREADLPEPFRTLLPVCFEEGYRMELGSDLSLQKARKELEA